MKSLFAIINASFNGKKLTLGIRGVSRYSSSGNLAFSSLCCLEDEGFIYDDFLPADGALRNNKSNPIEFEKHDLSFSGNDSFEFVDKDYIIHDDLKADDDEMKTIKLVLKKRGWNQGFSYGFGVDLNQFNNIRILDVLFEESSDAALALYFFNWSESFAGVRHTVWSVCRMIHILVSGNLNHRAVDLILRLVRYYGGKEGSYGLLLKYLYETHTERKVLERIYSMLVNCYIKENMLNLALLLTYQMKQLNSFPSRWVCKSMVKELLVSKKLDLAWDLLEEINQGIGLDASFISLFIHQYCMEGSISCGWKLLLEMKNFGFKPDAISYTLVIDSLCKLSFLKEATSLLFKMSELGASPDSVTISSVIDAYCKGGQSDAAINMLKVFNLPLNIFIYNSFISKLCMERNMVKASEIFYEMSESGLHPDCISYTTIVGGYCKVRELKKAFEYFGKMLKGGIQPSVTTYTLLVDLSCKLGDTEMAESLFHKMIIEGLKPDVVAYNTLMDGYVKKGQLHKALELLDIMRSASHPPDIITYNTLIHGFILRGFLSEAKYIVDELITRGFSLDVVTYTNVIDGFSKRGNFEEAFLVWFYMTDHHVKPDVVTCSALLNGYCREKRMAEAKALFHKMLDIGLDPDLILYNTLIRGFCSIGDMNEACNLVSKMLENGIFPNTITHRALVLGFEKKWVNNPEESATSKLLEILLRYDHHGDFDEYLRMVEKGEFSSVK